MRLRTSIGMIVLSAMVVLGCNDEVTAPADSEPADTFGALQVSINVNGPTVDADGYSVVVHVDGEGEVSSRPVESRGGTARISNLPAGTHSVGLESLPVNCTVEGENPRPFTVGAGEESRVRFMIACSGPRVAGAFELVSPEEEPGVSQRYVIGQAGSFWLQRYSAGSLDNEYPGTYSVVDTSLVDSEIVFGITFDFALTSTAGETKATGTLRGDCLTVEYNIVMYLTDFEDGEYCRRADEPDDDPDDEPATVTELTSGAAPDWSPDGGRIAFHRDGEIYVIRDDGSNELRLTAGTNPAWSPAGGSIAFDRDEKIYVIDVFDSETLLAQGTEPAWSPDGTKIAFTSNEGISVMNADGSGVTTLIRHDFRDDTNADWDMGVGRPAWSPDGGRIAFEHLGDGDIWPAQIFVMNADGSEPRRPTATGGTTYAESDPAWSPDGTRIVFWSYGFGIATVDADGGVPNSIYMDFPTVAYGAKPDFSPDGSRIAFTARPADADGPEIRIVRVD